MKTLLISAIIGLAAGTCHVHAAPPIVSTVQVDMDVFLNALQQVETSGKPNKGAGVVGDSGKAFGPLQIHEAAWKDAIQHDPSIGGVYSDCSGWEYSCKIAKAYFARYAGPNPSPEKMARIWNGGPSIYKRKGSKAWNNTTSYWEKVRKFL